MLSKNHIKMLWLYVLIGLIVFFGLNCLNADNIKTYPNCGIKEISNFKKYCEEIFQIVATKMELEISEGIPKPIILKDNQITLSKFNSYLGWDCNVILPVYFHKNNTLVIPRYSKLDSLVHEFVHYFHAMYRNEDLDSKNGMSADARELEALSIQIWFRAKFMRPCLPR